MDFQQRPQKMRKTKKKQNKKQKLMTHPTLEERRKLELKKNQLPQATLKMILQKIHEFKATVHEKHAQRITNPQRKRSAEKKKEKQ